MKSKNKNFFKTIGVFAKLALTAFLLNFFMPLNLTNLQLLVLLFTGYLVESSIMDCIKMGCPDE